MPRKPEPKPGLAVLIEDLSTVRSISHHRPLPLHSRVALEAIMSKSAWLKRTSPQHHIVFKWDGKYYPVFPGSVPRHRLGSGYINAATFQQPLLGSVEWARRPLWELFDEVKEVLEVGYGYDLGGATPRIRGFDVERLTGMTLENIEQLSAPRPLLVLGFGFDK